MDKEQEEMQYVGFFGIYKEAIKIIFSWKRIFTLITLTLILPLSVIFLAHIAISSLLGWRIYRTEEQIYVSDHSGSIQTNYNHLYHMLSREWITYWLFKGAYFTFLLLFSLLSTAAIVYTIASIYTSRDVTFKKVMKVVPKVWKRLVVTFLCTYLGFFIYNAIAFMVYMIWATTISDSTFGTVMIFILLFFYCVGFIYITIIWQLACVVTVLESSFGVKAMIKAKDLVKGKKWLFFFIFLVLYIVLVGIQILFYACVYGFGFLSLLLAIVSVFLLTVLFLVGFVAQTVLYLVCKSYHHEPIDKLTLSSQLGGYLGEFEPAFKISKDIQLGQPQPQVQV